MIPQHSLPGGRYPLPGPDFHRLDRASFAWRTQTASELDFAQIQWGFVSAWECSSGEACRVKQALSERSGDFYHVPALA